MSCESSLNLSLFGPVSLHRVEPMAAPQPIALCGQSRNLLAYLALSRGNRRSRAELAQALWDDAGEPARPGSVNTALYRLRQAIEQPPFACGALISTRRDGQVALRADAPLRIDVEDYLGHVLPVLALPVESMSETDAQRLRQGVALYSAELLEGLHDDWALRERERLRRHQLNALGRLMQWCARHGDAVGGIRHAQAILEIDALREDVHRDLMRLYLLAGQRALALRQYECCRAALKRELSIVPMPETQQLYQQIVGGAIARHGGVPDMADAALLLSAPPALAELLASARRHLALADAQLLRALPVGLQRPPD